MKLEDLLSYLNPNDDPDGIRLSDIDPEDFALIRTDEQAERWLDCADDEDVTIMAFGIYYTLREEGRNPEEAFVETCHYMIEMGY
jgi:hypothetical protein